MYAYASREEWLFRGLAIAMILALVGMAVMPMSVGTFKIGNYIILSEKYPTWKKAVATTVMVISTQLVSEAGGLIALAGAGPVGWRTLAAYVGILL